MTIPSSPIQLLGLLVLVVPGFVYQAVRIQLRGRTPNDSELSTRIMNAIVTSTIFDLLYVAVLGSRITDRDKVSHMVATDPRCAAWLAFLAAFAVPAAAAVLVVCLRNSERITTALSWRPSTWSRIDPRPSAWEVAFGGALPPRFVRVRMKDGTWYAGWLGENSYASAWPDPRTLFVEVSFHIDTSGTIGDQVLGSAGAVIDCTDAVLVELLDSPEAAENVESSGTMDNEEEGRADG